MSPVLAHAGAGAASNDVKKESATARLLGSGKMRPSHPRNARHQLLTPEYRLCWYRRADGFPSRTNRLLLELPSFSTDVLPPGRHHREAIDEQPDQGEIGFDC